MPFSKQKLLQHLMKLHLPGFRNKLMTKLLKLMKYQKHSRTLFLLLSRIKSVFWCLMGSPGHIHASFSTLASQASLTTVPWSKFFPDLPQKHIPSAEILRQKSKAKSARAHEKWRKNAWKMLMTDHARLFSTYKASEIFSFEVLHFIQKLCGNGKHQQWPTKYTYILVLDTKGVKESVWEKRKEPCTPQNYLSIAEVSALWLPSFPAPFGLSYVHPFNAFLRED